MDTEEIMRNAQLAARNYDETPPASVDHRYLYASRMVRAIWQLTANGVGDPGPALSWVADDTEECKFCAWPEHSTVVLRIGLTLTVCQEHVWRGLLAKLGDHPREGIGYPHDQHA